MGSPAPLLAPFLVEEESLHALVDPDRFVEALESGKTVQELVGFSEGVMSCFFRTAAHLLEDTRYEDARDAFTFLTVLAPQRGALWEGLGLANFYLRDYDAAIDAFIQEAELDPEEIDGFFMLARTLAEVHRHDEAETLLDQVIVRAGQNLDKEWAMPLMTGARETKLLVQENRRSGRL